LVSQVNSYLKKAQLKRQPNQHAAVLLPGQPVQLIKVATLRDLTVTDRQYDEFRRTCIETAGCYKAPHEAEAELTALEDKLLLEARPVLVLQSEKTAKGCQHWPQVRGSRLNLESRRW
jgi:hypothetical protein